MRRQTVRNLGIGAVAALALAGCGSDGASGDTDGGDGATEDPVKLAFLWEKAGESDVGTDDFQNGAELALEQLNAEGGIDGREVVSERFAASIMDPQATATEILDAADYEPAVMVGLILSSQAAAAVPQIDRAGVPTVMVAQPDQDLVFGGEFSSELMWTVQPYLPAVVSNMVDFMVEEQGFEQIGLMGTSEGFGQAGVAAATAALEEQGLEPFAERMYAPDLDDFAEIAVAMTGADAVLNWGFPNPLAAQIKQFAQNQLGIPTYDGPSAPIVAANKMAPPEAIEELSASLPCDAGDPQTPELEEMVAAYTEKFGMAPTYSAVSAYDAVLVAAAAIEEAGSTDPDAINEALAEVEVTGACGDYRADAGHVMFHQSQVVDFAADGSSKVATTIELPDTPEGG
jgi:branched-chain amino acid transport system substrate-binding protein